MLLAIKSPRGIHTVTAIDKSHFNKPSIHTWFKTVEYVHCLQAQVLSGSNRLRQNAANLKGLCVKNHISANKHYII